MHKKNCSPALLDTIARWSFRPSFDIDCGYSPSKIGAKIRKFTKIRRQVDLQGGEKHAMTECPTLRVAITQRTWTFKGRVSSHTTQLDCQGHLFHFSMHVVHSQSSTQWFVVLPTQATQVRGQSMLKPVLQVPSHHGPNVDDSSKSQSIHWRLRFQRPSACYRRDTAHLKVMGWQLNLSLNSGHNNQVLIMNGAGKLYHCRWWWNFQEYRAQIGRLTKFCLEDGVKLDGNAVLLPSHSSGISVIQKMLMQYLHDGHWRWLGKSVEKTDNASQLWAVIKIGASSKPNEVGNMPSVAGVISCCPSFFSHCFVPAVSFFKWYSYSSEWQRFGFNWHVDWTNTDQGCLAQGTATNDSFKRAIIRPAPSDFSDIHPVWKILVRCIFSTFNEWWLNDRRLSTAFALTVLERQEPGVYIVRMHDSTYAESLMLEDDVRCIGEYAPFMRTTSDVLQQNRPLCLTSDIESPQLVLSTDFVEMVHPMRCSLDMSRHCTMMESRHYNFK